MEGNSVFLGDFRNFFRAYLFLVGALLIYPLKTRKIIIFLSPYRNLGCIYNEENDFQNRFKNGTKSDFVPSRQHPVTYSFEHRPLCVPRRPQASPSVLRSI